MHHQGLARRRERASELRSTSRRCNARRRLKLYTGIAENESGQISMLVIKESSTHLSSRHPAEGTAVPAFFNPLPQFFGRLALGGAHLGLSRGQSRRRAQEQPSPAVCVPCMERLPFLPLFPHPPAAGVQPLGHLVHVKGAGFALVTPALWPPGSSWARNSAARRAHLGAALSEGTRPRLPDPRSSSPTGPTPRLPGHHRAQLSHEGGVDPVNGHVRVTGTPLAGSLSENRCLRSY
jgi:hypothetical protein